MQLGRAVVRFLAGCGLLLAGAAAALPTDMSLMGNLPRAPKLQLTELDGTTHALSRMRGKVVLVNFWATWCPPCREEMPSMQRLYEALRNRDFEILAVNVGERESEVFSYLHGELETEITFPVLLDPEAKAMERFPVKGLPTTFLVDRKGRLAYKAVGGRAMDKPAFKQRILDLLEEGS
ncbi:TlpA family protein disulfide reductase [Thiohalorhabdus sp. Cl-TMA]|uniref:TlpA family protein disulfide reductase n=1 Tax=Thiohalorhabdus methylotrophus TaxID=3242694 RepID=A0ABV4TWS6_9GAMM